MILVHSRDENVYAQLQSQNTLKPNCEYNIANGVEMITKLNRNNYNPAPDSSKSQPFSFPYYQSLSESEVESTS